jgi:hypothetical protein
MSKQQQGANPLAVIITVIILIFLGIWLFGGSGGEEEPKQQAKYEASIVSKVVDNPATLSVGIRVRNVSDTAGTSTCTITARDSGYSYTGVDAVTLKEELQPNESALVKVPLTITNEGARYVTQAEVECE